MINDLIEDDPEDDNRAANAHLGNINYPGENVSIASHHLINSNNYK